MQYGRTALHYAAKNNHTDAMSLLIEGKAQLEAKSNVRPNRVGVCMDVSETSGHGGVVRDVWWCEFNHAHLVRVFVCRMA